MALNMHLGEVADPTSTRLIIVFKQLAESPQNALVIKIDSVSSDPLREEIWALVNDPQSQNERNFADFLHKRGRLQLCHESKILTVMSIDQVKMTPGNGQKIPLRDVINSLNARNGLPPLPSKEEYETISQADPRAADRKRELDQTESKSAIARSIMVQAKLLQAEVDRKMNEAYNLDPSLRPLKPRDLVEVPIDSILNSPTIPKGAAKTTKKVVKKKAQSKKVVKKA